MPGHCPLNGNTGLLAAVIGVYPSGGMVRETSHCETQLLHTHLTLACRNTLKQNSWLPTVSQLSPCCCHQPSGESPWSIAWCRQNSTGSHQPHQPCHRLFLAIRTVVRLLPVKKGIWKDLLYLGIDFYTSSHSGSTTQFSWAPHEWSFVTG